MFDFSCQIKYIEPWISLCNKISRGLIAHGSIMRGYDFMYFAHFLTEYTYMLINILYLCLKHNNVDFNYHMWCDG